MKNPLFHIVLVIVTVVGLCSCSVNDPKSPSKDRKTVSVDPTKIERGPVRHARLSAAQVTRLRKVHSTFAEVDGQTFAEWEDDFKRDADPDENLRIWEDMEIAYLKFCEGKSLDVATRKEVFKVVLLRSMAPESEVLRQGKLRILSEAEAKQIMRGYPSEPKPVEVIQYPK